MSLSSERGRDFELQVAALLRKKLGARVERDRRSGAGANKADISDYYQQIPLHFELKDHETVKIKEWFKQADATSSFNIAPCVVFRADSEILATVRLSDLLNFLVEIADQKAEIDDLRQPVTIFKQVAPTLTMVTKKGNKKLRINTDPNAPPGKLFMINKNQRFRNKITPPSEMETKLADKVKSIVNESSTAFERSITNQTSTKVCRNDHIADEYGYCQQKGCKFARGYRPPKGKKKQ
jgi:Holliday junction resolvase